MGALNIFLDPAYVNSLGLIFDIFAALMLSKYGLPESISRGGVERLALEQINEEEKAKAEHYDRMAKIAIGLLVAGFLLQLISNYLLAPQGVDVAACSKVWSFYGPGVLTSS